MMGVYQIRNIINNKIYIGSSINLGKRWLRHRNFLKNNKHNNKHLQHAWNKYGKESFVFEVLEEIKDKNELINKEQYWMNKTNCFKNGYNINPNAGSNLGFKHSKETKNKMRQTAIGRKMSDEAKQKMSDTKKLIYTEEYKQKLSEANKGKKLSEETKLKISKTLKENRLGEDNPNSKLTNEDVIKIKILLEENILTQKEIGNIFNVTQTPISQIKLNKTWKHIQL